MSTKKYLIKFFYANLFSGKWFCNHKKFSTKTYLMKIFGRNLFSRKLFCNLIKFWTNNVLMKTLGANLFSGNWFSNIKKFSTKSIFMKIFDANLFTRKRFCNYKYSRPISFWSNFLVGTFFRGYYFATIKNCSTKTLLLKSFGMNLFWRKDFGTRKISNKKSFNENS